MIPKIIHQFWVGHYPIPQREKEAAEEIKEKHPNYDYHLWTDNNLFEIPEKYQKQYDLFYSNKDYVYCADMLKFFAVYNYGGYILDIDLGYIKSLDSLNIDHRDGIVFGHWGTGWTHCDYTFAPNIFGFKKYHPMIHYIVNNFEMDKPIDYNYVNEPYGPPWMGIIVKKYLGLENEFSNEIWEYHRIVKEYLNKHNIEYGDYNTFQNEILRHYSLYSWSKENKEKFEQGLVQ